ncbi:KptA family-domain-containing protein [Echria macrotheca]|uniref:2'-phosphotransferase n=1 Tax=Echria macrotheca TaxID=438768 RepID=A0AAJ0B4V7_9PEZI|nr:KptA family-domain-containing protein [Echria macrotheca]
MANTNDVDQLAEQFEDQAFAGSSSRGGGKSSGGGGGRGSRFRNSRGGGGSKSREVDLSRALSRLLRHQAENAGIKLDGQGFAPLDRVLQWGPLQSLSPSFAEILALVNSSDKQRFALKPKGIKGEEKSTDPKDWLIRANQGHSIKLESDGGLLRPIALPDAEGGDLPDGAVPIPEVVVHGTYFAFWPRIVESGGLKPMGRNHVHFSTGLPEDSEAGVVSGMRRDAQVLVFVDVEASMRGEEGLKWWVSDNGVVLTEGREGDGVVPVKYFKEVRGRAQGVGVLWRDGEWVADLPEGVRAGVPMGKGRGGGGRGRGRGRGGKA